MRNYWTKLIGVMLCVGVLAALLSACAPHASNGTVSVTATATVSGAPINQDGLSATATAKNLTMSLSVTPGGPYFLSELVSVSVSLANHSHSPVTLDGPSGAGACGSALYFEATGGGAPHYDIPTVAGHSCPADMRGTTVRPGQTLTIRQLFPITDSGAVTLTGGMRFLVTTMQQGVRTLTDGPTPLDGHWPAIHLNVNPHIPASRALSLRRVGPLIYVTAPSEARAHLIYMFNVTCYDKNDSGSTWTGNFEWDPVVDGVVHQPGCPGVRPRWEISVSAPGYAIASGTYQ